MQWDAGEHAGFSDVRPWLPIPDSYKTHNVASESRNPDSILNLYKRLLALRRSHPALLDGQLIFVNSEDPSVLSYVRKNSNGGPSVLVALNMTDQPHTVGFDLSAEGLSMANAKTLVATEQAETKPDLGHVNLPPFGLYIAEVQ